MPDDNKPTDQPVVGGGMPGVTTPPQVNPDPTAPVTEVPVVEQPPVTGVPPAPKVEETPDTTPTV